MSTSPSEVRPRRSGGVYSALALCVMALGMVVGSARAATTLTMTSHSPTHYPSPGSINVAQTAPIVLNFNGPVDPNNTNLLTTDNNGFAKITVSPSIGAGGVPLDLSASFSNNNTTITINHTVPFDQQTSYIVRVERLISGDQTNFPNKTYGNPNTVDALVPVSSPAVNPFTFRTIDQIPPYIVSHSPSDNPGLTSTGASLGPNGSIQVTFDEPMIPASVQANSTVVATSYNNVVTDFKPNVTFTFDVTGQNLTIALVQKSDGSGPVTPWPGSKSATQLSRVTVTINGTDLVGNALTSNPNGVDNTNRNPWNFTITDTIPPGLVSSSPSQGDTNVSASQPVILHFDEPVDCSQGPTGHMTTQSQTIGDPFSGSNPPTFLIYQVPGSGNPSASNVPPGAVTATCSDNNTTVTLNHSFLFSSSTNYAVRILGEADVPSGSQNGAQDDSLRDAVGNKLANSITVTFGVKNVIPPVIVSATPPFNQGIQLPGQPPVTNDQRVSPTAPIVLSFSKPIDTTSFAVELRLEVAGKGESDWPLVPVTVTFSNNNQTATITPTQPLQSGINSIYQLRLGGTAATHVFDLLGNQLVGGGVIPSNPNSPNPNNLNDVVLTFQTKILTGPSVSNLNPPNGAVIDPGTLIPVGGNNPVQTILITLNENINNTANDTAHLPIIAIRYARAQGDTRPIPPLPRLSQDLSQLTTTLTPLPNTGGAPATVAQPVSQSPGQVLYQVKSTAVTNNPDGTSTITLHFDKFMELCSDGSICDVQTDPRNATGGATPPITTAADDQYAFAPGENAILQVTQAFDLNGNAIQTSTTPQPNPWIYGIIDVRPPSVTRVRVGGQDVSLANETVPVPPQGQTQPLTQFDVYPLVSLRAPVEVTFSKPMSTAPPPAIGRLVFQADGNYCSSADLLTGAPVGNLLSLRGDTSNPPDNVVSCAEVGALGNAFDPTAMNFWVARVGTNNTGNPVYSADLRTVTLTHEPFPETNPADTNVSQRRPTNATGDHSTNPNANFTAHKFIIYDALDQTTPTPNHLRTNGVVTVSSNLDFVGATTPPNNLFMTPPGSNGTFAFITTSSPRVKDIQFEVSFDKNNAGNDMGNTIGNDLDPGQDGLLNSDTSFRQWVSFQGPNPLPGVSVLPLSGTYSETGGAGNLDARVPLNSRFQFIFNSQMNQTSIPAPQFTHVNNGANPITGWTAAWNAASNMVVWDHTDLLTGVNQPYNFAQINAANDAYGPSGAVYQGLTIGTGIDIKGDTLVADANAFASTNVNPIDVTPPATFTVEYLSNLNADPTMLCVNGSKIGFDATKAVWLPLNGATNVPINTRFRVRMNETFGPGGTWPINSIALKLSPQGTSNASDITVAGGIDAKGRPTHFVDQSGAGASARQDWLTNPSSASTTIRGGQSIFTLPLISSTVGTSSNGRAAASYSIKFTGGDTRLDDDGDPANFQGVFPVVGTLGPPPAGSHPERQFGQLPAPANVNVGLFGNPVDQSVPGNQVSMVANFSTEDINAPVVRTITASPSLATADPNSPITVQFDVPVDITTVNLTTVHLPSGITTIPQFTKAYGSNGTDKTTVVFTPTAPLAKPASGAANTYAFSVNTGVKALAAATPLTCNDIPSQGSLALLNLGKPTDQNPGQTSFTVGVPASTTPPAVTSIVSTREEITLQFNQPVISTTDTGNAGWPNSAANPNNYVAAKLPEIGNTPWPSDAKSAPNKANITTGDGYVNYSYYDPNRTVVIGGTIVNGQLTGGQTVLSPGYVTVNKKIRFVNYNTAANAVVLTTDPMTEGQGTNQAESVEVFLPAGGSAVVNNAGGIMDLNTNNLAATTLDATIQPGRADWVIQMSATSNVPGASPDTNNFFGVRGIAGVANSGSGGTPPASDGLDGPDTDIPKPLAPGANHVFLYSARGANEPGFQGQGGNFAQELQSRPLLNTVKVWPRIGVTSDLGATGAPATITISWNLAVPNREVPTTYSAELINTNPQPGEPTSIDMRAVSSFSYTVQNNGLDQTRFFRLEVTSPSVLQAPFQLSNGFNLIGVPARLQNPVVTNVFFGLSPLVVYRYDPNTGYEIFPSSPNFVNVEAGRGYWVRPSTAGYQIKTLGVPIVGQSTLALKKGWNLISDPYLVPVSGANLQVVSGTNTLSVADAVKQGLLQDSFVTFDPTAMGYTAPQPLSTGTLQPWRGYWVLAFQDVNLLVSRPPTITTGP